MSSSNRNRSEGWEHAKISGHNNELKIKHLLLHDNKTQKFFLEKINKTDCKIINVETGGITEKNVDSIFEGETTKSKTDMYVYLSDGSKYNISIKKSVSGQVYLIGIIRFIKGFEKKYGIKIPQSVKDAISFFWGCNQDTINVIKTQGTHKKYETRKNRLVADTLKVYDEYLYDVLLDWFRENIKDIADFCFSKGLALNKNDWANIVWYKNELDENKIDEIFYLPDLFSNIKTSDISLINYGSKGGGTTIQLPFGFVQWHSPSKKIPGDMQFHHNYSKIKIISSKDK